MANFNIFHLQKTKLIPVTKPVAALMPFLPNSNWRNSPRPAALTIPFMLPLKISWNKSSRLRKKSSHYLLPKRLSMHANAAI